MFRKADLILMAVLIIVGIASSVALTLGESTGETVKVSVDGQLYGTYPLNKDQTIIIDKDKTGAIEVQGDTIPDQYRSEKYNILIIKDGKVNMLEASCKNQVCVDHAPISMTGESIICLPNRVIVTVEGGNQEFDAISN